MSCTKLNTDDNGPFCSIFRIQFFFILEECDNAHLQSNSLNVNLNISDINPLSQFWFFLPIFVIFTVSYKCNNQPHMLSKTISVYAKYTQSNVFHCYLSFIKRPPAIMPKRNKHGR